MILIFISLISDVEHLFMCLFGHLYVVFGEIAVQSLCPFFNRLVFIELLNLF